MNRKCFASCTQLEQTFLNDRFTCFFQLETCPEKMPLGTTTNALLAATTTTAPTTTTDIVTVLPDELELVPGDELDLGWPQKPEESNSTFPVFREKTFLPQDHASESLVIFLHWRIFPTQNQCIIQYIMQQAKRTTQQAVWCTDTFWARRPILPFLSFWFGQPFLLCLIQQTSYHSDISCQRARYMKWAHFVRSHEALTEKTNVHSSTLLFSGTLFQYCVFLYLQVECCLVS